MKRILLLFAAIGLASPALAQNGLAFGEMTVGGAACQGTGSVALVSGVRIATFNFVGYSAEVSGPLAGTTARATCNLAIPVDVPDSTSVAIVGAEYRMTAGLRPGSTAAVSLEAFLAGDQGPVLTRTYEGTLAGTFVGSTTVAISDRQWSACGADVIIRANSSLLLDAARVSVIASTANLQLVRVRLAIRSC